jgi:ribonuclease HI
MITVTNSKGSKGSYEITVGHLIPKDVRPLECSFPYQTLLVKGSVSFKEGEEAKAIPNGSNQLNENIKHLEKEAIYYFTDGSKMCNHEFVGFSCVTTSEEIRHQYWTTNFASIFIEEAMVILKNLEIISEFEGESFCIYSDSRSVLMCLNERLLTKKHSILILTIKEKLVALKKHKKDIKYVWIPAHMGIALNEIADGLAKESIRNSEDVQYLMPVTDLKCY